MSRLLPAPAAISASRPNPVVVSAAAGGVLIDRTRRRMRGTLVRAGEIGQTDAGPIRVPDPSLLEWPADLSEVDLTREHELDVVRGSLQTADVSPERIYIEAMADRTPEGDAALEDVVTRRRAGFSFRVERPLLRPGADGIPDLIGGLVTSVGQVAEPAYNSARIDAIAAARGHQTPGTEPGPTKEKKMKLTPEQIARLAELRALTTLTAEQAAELADLAILEAADQADEDDPADPEDDPADPAPADPAPVSAARAPAGLPRRAGAVRTQERGTALQRLVRQITQGLQAQAQGGSALQAISAAFSDVTSTANTANVEQVAWSDELWSGLQYEPAWSDLLVGDTLTHWTGDGWRFVITPPMQDYAGDKAAVPSGIVKTEQSSYDAARMAVGVDVDRKFYDFPNEAFVSGLLERVRESWEIGLDGKSRTYIQSAAVPAGRLITAVLNGTTTVTSVDAAFVAGDVGKSIVGPGIPEGATITAVSNATTVTISAAASLTGTVFATVSYAASATILDGVARLAQALKNTRVGRASWIMLADDDMLKLLDLNQSNLPVFLDLWGIDPRNFRSSPNVAPGTILGGVKQAAKLRTLPGSPVRVSAQNLANGGVDEAFFGYWAVEEHHPRGIMSTSHTQA